MKFLNAFLALMFLSFAALQLNDPDPILWVLIYGAMVAVCMMAMYNKYNKILLSVLELFYIGYCFVLWPGVAEWWAQDDKSVLFDDVMKMEYPYIEESREFLGLVICLVVLTFYTVLAYRKKPA
jgi:hypothetical protein